MTNGSPWVCWNFDNERQPTQEDLSSASTEHIRAARAALAVGVKRSGASGVAPRSAAYLAHIAMECALKLRMLMQHHRARTEEMRKVMKEQDFDLLFRSKHGHELHRLSEQASLKRLLAVDNDEALLERKAWKRMISGERPFDLRYGTASPSREQAEAEVDLASAIVTAIHKQRGG